MSNHALVTGASCGIGLDLARLLAKDKNNLVLVARSENKLKEIKASFEKEFGINVKIIIVDLSLPDATTQLYDEIVKEQITIDILINNAGFGDFSSFSNCDWQKQEKMINLNVLSLSKLTHLILPGMIKQGYGKIMNLGSLASFLPGPMMATYYATKAFVLSFSCSLANELKGTGITVTALCPGPVDTGFVAAAALEGSKLFHSFKPMTAIKVAEFGYRRMMKGKLLAIPGAMNKLMVTGIRFSPRKVVAIIVRKIQEKRQ